MASLRTLGVLLAGAGSLAAVAQPAPAPKFERNPLYPAPVTIYGRVSVGPVRVDRFEPLAGDDKNGLANLEKSFVGIRGVEILDSGWMANFQLESGFDTNNGALDNSSGPASDPCTASDNGQRFFGRRATVGLAQRELGRVDLGLLDQPAVVLLRQADPWGGNTEATAGRRAYLSPTKCATRSAGSITYQTPTYWDWKFSLQVGYPEPYDESTYRTGLSIAWDRKPWLAGVGWQQWNDGSRALPVVLVHDSGTLRLSSAFTQGRAATDEYRNYFLGARWPVMAKGSPTRQEWLLGLNRFDADGAQTSDWKIAAGWRYHFSRQFAFLADVAQVRRGGGASQLVLDFGLSYGFARDLRWPQEPW